MKRLFPILSLFICLVLVPSVKAQFTTVSATVVDPNSVPYANCHVSASYVPSPTATTQALIAGSTFQTVVPAFQCDSFGHFSVTLVDNTQVSDGHSGGQTSKWSFSITSGPGYIAGPYSFTYTAVISGTTMDISAALKAAAAPFPALSSSFSGITSGTNTSANMVVGTGASLTTSGSGTITANGAPFSGLTGGTNTTAAMLVGNGASLGPTGSGTLTATTMPWAGLTSFPSGCTNQVITAILLAPTCVSLTTAFLPTTGTWAFGGTLSGNITLSGADTFTDCPQLGTVICVDGIMYAQTPAGIRAAIVAAGSSGTVYLAAPSSGASYPFGVSDSCILIDKPIDIGGNMLHGGTQIQVAAGVSATQDIFCITPATDGEGIRIHDLEILPASGTPGRYAFHLNGANHTIQHFSMERVEVLQLGSNAVFVEAVGNSNGSPVVSDFNHNVLYGGMVFQNAGDTVRIKDNHLTGSGKLDFAFAAGSSTLELEGNNITVDGGIHVAGIANSSGVGCIIADNEIETFGTFTGSNGSVLDLDGISGSHNTDCMIGPKNNIQVVNGITANGIRVNYADRTQIQGNRLGRGAGGSLDITVTANATDTFVGLNTWVNGTPFSSMLSDSGTRTVLATLFNNALLINNNKNLAWIDDGGTQRSVINTDNTGTVNIYGYHGFAMMSGANPETQFFVSGTAAQGAALRGAPSSFPQQGTYFTTAAHVNKEVTAPTSTAGYDICYGDSTAHAIECGYNGGGFNLLPTVTAADTTTTHVLHATATGNVFTSSAIATGDLPTAIPIANVGSAGLSGTAPATITAAGAIGCATCVTSAAALTSNAVVIGGGGQASSTISADTTTTHALFATGTAPAFRALATGDMPATVVQTGQVNTGAAAMTLNMAASTTANSFVAPAQAGLTSGTNGAIAYDTTNNNTHIRTNAADSIAVAEAAALAANVIPKQTDATHGLVAASLASDNGTALTYTGTGGVLSSGNNAILTTDFTDTSSASLQNVTGLNFTLPANTARNYEIDCNLMWSQATFSGITDQFGLQDVTVAPTRIDGYGLMSVAGPGAVITNAIYGVLTNLTTTTATAIVSAIPTVATINFAQLHFTVQQPSNASTSVLQIMVSQSTAADVIVVRAGSSCRLN